MNTIPNNDLSYHALLIQFVSLSFFSEKALALFSHKQRTAIRRNYVTSHK